MRGNVLGIEEISQCHSLNMGELCLQRATQGGAFLGTSEMLLFQIMQGAKVMPNI